MSRLSLLMLACLPLAFAALPANWDDLDAMTKYIEMKERINRDPYTGVYPTSGPSMLSMGNMLLPSFLAKPFLQTFDEQEKRLKLIHTYGTVAPIEFRVNADSRYTGLFKAGQVSKGLARLSMARYDVKDVKPGGAFKFFVDFKPSLNIIAMFGLDGQGKDQNFFANTFWNIIADPTALPLKILAKAFALALKQIPGGVLDRPEKETNLPLYEHASVDAEGNTPAVVFAPYRISFIPNPALGWDSNSADDFRVHLAAIPSGSKLYTVAVNRQLGEPDEIIGEIVTDGAFVASEYGDMELFFQHHGKRWRP